MAKSVIVAGKIGLYTADTGGASFAVSITGDPIPSSAVQPDSKLAITWRGVKVQH